MPRVDELVRRGLAHPISWTADGTATRWNIHTEGHALLGRIMRENGLEAQMNGSADWVQPPSQSLPPVAQLVAGHE